MSNAKNIGEVVPDPKLTLNPDQWTDLIVRTYKAGFRVYKRPLLGTGSPGCGKTSAVKEAARVLGMSIPGFEYIHLNPATRPAEELSGIPSLATAADGSLYMRYALPTWLSNLKPDGRGIINIDDGTQGNGEAQKFLAELFLERIARDYDIPEGYMFVLTGNSMSDKAGAVRTMTHLRDRICGVNVKTDPRKWVKWAINHNIHEVVVAFIAFKGEQLDCFDPNEETSPTPRSWEAVSNWLTLTDTIPEVDGKNTYALALIEGEIGKGMAKAFWAFLGLYGRLPDLDDVIAHPTTTPIDPAMDVRYAMVTALAGRANEQNMGAILKYTDRIGTDLSVLCVKVAMQRDQSCLKGKAFTDWAVANEAALHGAW